MMDATGALGPFQGVGQRIDSCLLAHEIRKQAGTVLECKSRHGIHSTRPRPYVFILGTASNI